LKRLAKHRVEIAAAVELRIVLDADVCPAAAFDAIPA
jgi:hypothetical protein